MARSAEGLWDKDLGRHSDTLHPIGTHTTLRTRKPLRKLLEAALRTPQQYSMHVLGIGISVRTSRLVTSRGHEVRRDRSRRTDEGDDALIEARQH